MVRTMTTPDVRHASGFLALLFVASCASARVAPPAISVANAVVCPPGDESDVAPTPTMTDLAVLRHADALLSGPSAWNHFGDRECDAAARSWNLYCVLHRASLDVMGVACHRSAAMQEVRWVVDDRTRGVELAHRLMDYNNLPTTTFADIKGVLAEAIQRLSAKLHAS
jgi:hypothetical protein